MSSSSETATLTDRQRELLDFIESSVGLEGRMPSYREMATALGVKAVGTIQDLVQALVGAGYVSREGSSARPRLKLAGHRQASIVNVPLVGEVAAGALRDAFEVALGSVPVAPHLLETKTALKPGRCFALRVRGDSMIDAGILPGDVVVVEREARWASGDIVVAEYRGEATLKEIETPKRGSGDPIRLLPKNTRLKPIVVDDPDALRVVGRVVSVQRFL